MWDWRRLAELVRDGLAAREQALREEQAVYGLDSLRETQMHPLLAETLAAGGFGVLREQPYPSAVGSPGARPRKSARDRCDLVLTPQPGMALADPMESHREQDWLRGKGERLETPSLFAEMAAEELEQHSSPWRQNAVAPQDAAWIEVKVVAQFTFTQGVPGPNSAYSSELTGSLARDLAKLGDEPLVRSAAVLLVLFSQDERTAEHDVTMALHRCLDRGLRLRSPECIRFPILDRVGNAIASVVVIPT